MKFTDEDLKRLKADSPRNRTYLDFDKTKALLSRLEAAEDHAEFATDLNPELEGTMTYQLWQKSKGL